jgi:hypothetical protein
MCWPSRVGRFEDWSIPLGRRAYATPMSGSSLKPPRPPVPLTASRRRMGACSLSRDAGRICARAVLTAPVSFSEQFLEATPGGRRDVAARILLNM